MQLKDSSKKSTLRFSTSPLCLLVWCLCVFSNAARAAEVAAPPSLVGQRVLWLGDSITQDGQYVTDVEYYLDRRFPDQAIDIISIGLASETASGLSERMHPFPRPDVHERLQRALDSVKPKVVVACYGMNDGIYHPPGAERLKAFQDGINSLIAKVRAAGAQLILLTPPPYDALPVKSVRPLEAPDFGYRGVYEKYDTVLAEYSAWEQTLNSPDVLVVDVHSPLNVYLQTKRQNNSKFSFSRDGIHPNTAGHLLMAHTLLQALQLPVAAPDLDAELARLGADPLFNLVSQHRRKRSDGWLAYVGYTRGPVVKTDSIDATEQAATLLQSQINEARKNVANAPLAVSPAAP